MSHVPSNLSIEPEQCVRDVKVLLGKEVQLKSTTDTVPIQADTYQYPRAKQLGTKMPYRGGFFAAYWDC